MDVILVSLEKVKTSGRVDYDFYDPSQENITDNMVKGYKKDSLGNVCLKVTSGKTAPRNAYPEKGVRIIKVKNTTGNGIRWEERFFITPEFYDKAKNKAQVQVGDMLILCCAHNKSYIGRIDIIDDFPKEVKEDGLRCCSVGELIIIRANPEKIVPEYLLTFLRLPIVQEQIRRMVKGQSAHLYSKDLVKLEVVLPPKDVQKMLAKMNAKSQKEFLYKIKEAKDSLAATRNKIEGIIINGKLKKR